MATEWTAVRMSKELYERLVDRREETNLPIAAMVRVAVEKYLEPGSDSKLFLKMLRENLDFADEVREIILKEKEIPRD